MTTDSAPVAIVTGAGRGLGAAVADRLVLDGWSVVAADVVDAVLAHDDEPALTPTGDRTRADRGIRVGHLADVSSASAVADLVTGAVNRFGRIDAVINNAGVGGPTEPVTALAPADFMRVLEINLLGPFLVARTAAPVMVAGGHGGRIVNIGSLFGQQAVAGGAAYCASKAGVTALTQTLALELAPHGITVNTVAPGNMWTAMHADEVAHRAALAGRSVDQQREELRRSIPLGRHGTGEDIAGAVAWLLGDDAAYVTGQTISVNGGVHLT